MMNDEFMSRPYAVIDETWYERPDGILERTSAGGFVARIDDDGDVLIGFAREGDHDTLVVPKGGVDPGETIEQAAKREIEEELGVRIDALETVCDLGALARLNFRRSAWVTVHYFLFRTEQVDGTPTDSARHWHGPTWVPLDDPPDLFWPEQQRLLRENTGRIRELVLGSAQV